MPTIPPPATPPPARSGLRLRFVGAEAGFTLVEVLVSALIIVLIGSAAATALIATAAASGDQRFRSQADQLAAQDLARLQGLSDEQLNDYNQSRPVTLNGSTYIVTSTSSFQDTSGNSGCAATAASYFKTTSAVSWTENGNPTPQTVTEESLLSRPVSGDLRIQVQDQTGHGLPGASVSAISGSNTQSATTDTTGCVLFAGLTPASYTVNAAHAGYVDMNGNPPPLSSTATVTSSGVATPATTPLVMGVPGSLAGTLTGYTSPTSVTTGEADALSWTASGWSGTTTGVFPTTQPPTPGPASTTLTVSSLFPFDTSAPAATPSYSNNYTVWGGRCLQQKPPPTNLTPASVSAGVTYQAQSVQEPFLYLGSVKYNNAPVKPAHVKLAFQSTTGPNCSDTWFATVASATTVPPTGWLANPGQPYSTTTGTLAGTLTACADYTDPITGKSYARTVAAPNGNSTFSSVAIANSVQAITLTARGTC